MIPTPPFASARPAALAPRRAAWLVAPLLALLAGASPTAGAPAAPTTPRGAGSAPSGRPAAVLVFSGGLQGFIEQAGCARSPLGGLDRRSGHLQQLRSRFGRVPILPIDVGNFSDRQGPAAKIRTGGLLAGLQRLGYLAAGVGERELALGPAAVAQLADGLAFPLVATNLVLEPSRGPWLTPAAVLRAGTGQITVLSVVRHNGLLRIPLADGESVVTVDPAAALERLVPRRRGAGDLVVVLAALPLDDARALARRVPGIDLIVGAHGGLVLLEPEIEGATRLVYVGDEGKYAAQVEVYRRDGAGRPEIVLQLVTLGDAVAPDPAIAGFVAGIEDQARAAERMRSAAGLAGGDEPAGLLVGPASCRECHPEIHAEWQQSPHARAFAALSPRRGAGGAVSRIPSTCARCHATGSALVGGFIDQETTPQFAAVSCESCHGPGAEHVVQPRRPYGRIRIGSCIACHTPTVDPDFNFYADLPLVRHGAASGR